MGCVIFLIFILLYVVNVVNFFDFIKNEVDIEILNILIDRNFVGLFKRYIFYNGRQKKNLEMQLDLNNLLIRGEEELKILIFVLEVSSF